MAAASALLYVVERTLDAPGAKIKEAAVGIEALHRDPATFDPRLDPIVRVEARRLRDRLQAYYRAQGAGDPVAIDLPRQSRSSATR